MVRTQTDRLATLNDATAVPCIRDGNLVFKCYVKDSYNVVITDQLIRNGSGQEVLDFDLPVDSDDRIHIANELFVDVGGSRFRIRQMTDQWDDMSQVPVLHVHAEARWYDLGEMDPIAPGAATPITDGATAINTILANTGWTVGTNDQAAAKGTLQITTAESPLSLLLGLPAIFSGEIYFDNINKQVNWVRTRGAAAAVALYGYGKNLAGSQRIADTTNLVTRLYVYGATAASTIKDAKANTSGKLYIEDYSFYDSAGLPRRTRVGTVTSDKIIDPDVLYAWGQNQLSKLSQPAYTYNIQQSNTGENDPLPQLGDVIRVHDTELGFDISTRVETRTRNTRQPWLTNYTLDSTLFTLSNVVTGGGGGGGGGGDDTTIPSPPASVIAEMVGVAAPKGGGIEVQAEASWSQVTTNVDGTPINDLAGYEIQWSYNGSTWSASESVDFDTTFVVVGTFPNNKKTLYVRVRAVDSSGNKSTWKATPGTPLDVSGTAPPPPSQPTLDTATFPSLIRSFWDGKDNSGIPMPSDVIRVDVHVSPSGAGFTPSAATFVGSIVGGAGVFDYAAKMKDANGNPIPWWVRFVAVNSSLEQSQPSVAAGPVNTRQLVDTDAIDKFVNERLMGPDAVDKASIKDLAVGSAKMEDLAVVNAKIGDLEVNTAKINDVTADRIKAGIMQADIVVGGSFSTSATGSGQRVDFNANGILMYGTTSDSQPLVSIQPGSFTIQTALSGPSISIGAAPGDRIRFYSGVAKEQFPGIVQSAVSSTGQPTLYMRPAQITGWTQAPYFQLQASGGDVSMATLWANYLNVYVNNSATPGKPVGFYAMPSNQDQFPFQILGPGLSCTALKVGPMTLQNYTLDFYAGGAINSVASISGYGGSLDIGPGAGADVRFFWQGGSQQVMWDHTIPYPFLRAGSSGNPLGIKWGSSSVNAVLIRDRQDQNDQPLRASNLSLSSSAKIKQDVEPHDTAKLLDVVRKAPTYAWRYQHEADPERLAGGDKALARRFKTKAYRDFRLHHGPVIEDLPRQFQFDPDDHGNPTMELRDMVGVLWGAIQELDKRIEAAAK